MKISVSSIKMRRDCFADIGDHHYLIIFFFQNIQNRTISTIYKYYTEKWKEQDNWDNNFWLPLEKYGELDWI